MMGGIDNGWYITVGVHNVLAAKHIKYILHK